MTDPLREHHDIVALAERRAERLCAAYTRRAAIPDFTYRVEPKDVEAQLDLLLDPAEPDIDALSRILAARVGLVVGATAPGWGRFVCGERCCDGERGRMVPCSRPIWSLMGENETQMVTFADCPDPDEWDGDERRHVPGISTLTSPTEALFAALIATRPT